MAKDLFSLMLGGSSGSSVCLSVCHGGVTNGVTDPLRGGGEAGEGLSEILAGLGGMCILLLALIDIGKAALLRAQAAADEAAAQRAAAEALVQIAQRDNQTVNFIARSQAAIPVLMWAALLVAGLAVLAVVGLAVWRWRERQQSALAWGPGYGRVAESTGRAALPAAELGQALVLRERPRIAVLRE